ncbi:ABC transporter permease [Sphingosinicella microcystinivorans]|uniref:Peptide ABC transporter permease n=2 Tax=Sphingosinicella microcystinivorans TaxID=335406 RepID=A0AAD1D548_SPHMI|nr:ABC transporter permease [Sphingosinicella microcystinivorans]RKS91061.1 peptide/nickel transport system permease protein [Sphingosinicella microcystinivorans]BBE33982.1 peptide ABC transporter permease [Sphingosinicella microcystinivorans]
MLKTRPSGIVGMVVLALVVSAAIAGAIATPFDPTLVDFSSRLLPPSLRHWLGTDEWGRDVFSRLLSGAAITVSVAGMTTLLVTVFGALLGAFSGFVGGWFDRVVVALMDAFLAFPALVLAIAMTTVLAGSPVAPVIALAVAYMPYMVRVVRANVMTMRQRDFIAASKVMRNSAAFTLVRHIMPNTVAPVLVMATSLFGWALLAESALSFLGLGLAPPAASWGGMLADSRNYFADAPWLAIAPGVAISGALLGINLFGDFCRDYFDRKMKD